MVNRGPVRGLLVKCCTTGRCSLWTSVKQAAPLIWGSRDRPSTTGTKSCRSLQYQKFNHVWVLNSKPSCKPCAKRMAHYVTGPRDYFPDKFCDQIRQGSHGIHASMMRCVILTRCDGHEKSVRFTQRLQDGRHAQPGPPMQKNQSGPFPNF